MDTIQGVLSFVFAVSIMAAISSAAVFVIEAPESKKLFTPGEWTAGKSIRHAENFRRLLANTLLYNTLVLGTMLYTGPQGSLYGLVLPAVGASIVVAVLLALDRGRILGK